MRTYAGGLAAAPLGATCTCMRTYAGGLAAAPLGAAAPPPVAQLTPLCVCMCMRTHRWMHVCSVCTCACASVCTCECICVGMAPTSALPHAWVRDSRAVNQSWFTHPAALPHAWMRDHRAQSAIQSAIQMLLLAGTCLLVLAWVPACWYLRAGTCVLVPACWYLRAGACVLVLAWVPAC